MGVCCSCCGNAKNRRNTLKGRDGQIEEDHLSLRKNVTVGYVSPSIGFVIKTRRPDDSKVFINIYYHAYIKMMYPLPLAYSLDKAGTKCEVYSVILPNALFLNGTKDPVRKDKLCKECIEFINRTYKESLRTDYSTPKIAKGYVGELAHTLDIPQEYLIVQKRVMSPPPGAPTSTEIVANQSTSPDNTNRDKNNNNEIKIDDNTNKDGVDGTTQGGDGANNTTGDNQFKTPIKKQSVNNPILSASASSAASSMTTGRTPLSARYKHDPNDDSPDILKAWAKKKSKAHNPLRTRYFVLHHGALSYFADSCVDPPYGTGHKGTMSLKDFNVKTSPNTGEENMIILEANSGVDFDEVSSTSTFSVASNKSLIKEDKPHSSAFSFKRVFKSNKSSDTSHSHSGGGGGGGGGGSGNSDSGGGGNHNTSDGDKHNKKDREFMYIVFPEEIVAKRWLEGFQIHKDWANQHPLEHRAAMERVMLAPSESKRHTLSQRLSNMVKQS